MTPPRPTATVRADPTGALPRAALTIRALEYKLLDLFKQGEIGGTVHTCVGQEIGAAALGAHLRPGSDAIFATHRGHGFYLASGAPPEALLAELTGREGAACLGRGGTQHLHSGRFFANGIQGSGALHAVGYAFTLARAGRGEIAVAQIGDGTLGEGALHEAFTFAAVLRAPVLFFLEHNGWAQSTDTSTTTPGDLLARARGFGLDCDRRDDGDPVALTAHLQTVVERVRSGRPFLQILDTRRLLAHSKGDDDRPRALLERQWREDPLASMLAADAEMRAIDAEVRAQIEASARDVLGRPRLSREAVRALPPARSSLTSADIAPVPPPAGTIGEETTVVEALNRALAGLLRDRPDVVVLGEDVRDPYGGAFKVTRGLSTAHPDRVLGAPIAEAGIVGVGNGMALAGLRPVVEIMFGDFVALAADQLVNAAAKMYAMYGGKVTCPITCRVVSGGGRGYGPTHSQSLERMFCGVPGLRVLALSRRHDPGRLLPAAVLGDDSPKIFVEHKTSYPLALSVSPPLGCEPAPVVASPGDFPALAWHPTHGVLAAVTVVTYGGMTSLVEEAMRDLLIEDEVSCEYLVVTQLSPLDAAPVAASVARTRRLVVVEEHAPQWGFGSAVIAAVAQALDVPWKGRAVGALPVPIPAVRALEDAALPSRDAVRASVLGLL